MVPLKKDAVVKKKSGATEAFSEDKLRRSLERCGASSGLISRVLAKVEAKYTDEMNTTKIHQMAMDLLQRESKTLAANYSIKKAIQDLGPAGFHFEKLVSQILTHEGFDVEVGTVLPGRCVNHEVDVIARGQGKTYFIECKFHNGQGKKNDIKTALYIYARNLDLKESTKVPDFDQYWLASNTSFTVDAITYGNCVGLKLLGVNYPEHETLGDLIKKHNLYPLTSLKSLKQREKEELLDSGVITCRDLWQSPDILTKMLGSKQAASQVLSEVRLILSF